MISYSILPFPIYELGTSDIKTLTFIIVLLLYITSKWNTQHQIAIPWCQVMQESQNYLCSKWRFEVQSKQELTSNFVEVGDVEEDLPRGGWCFGRHRRRSKRRLHLPSRTSKRAETLAVWRSLVSRSMQASSTFSPRHTHRSSLLTQRRCLRLRHTLTHSICWILCHAWICWETRKSDGLRADFFRAHL